MSAFSDIITFSRASAAWRFNSAGVLEQVPANQPRFDYDPVTRVLKGLLVEEQRTNLFTYSEDFSNGAWVKGTLTTVEPSSASWPTGGFMQKLVETTANDLHSVYQSRTVTASSPYVLSLHMGQGERRYAALNIGTSRNQCVVAVFDLQTGVVVRSFTNGNTFAFVAAGIINCGGGVYRPWVCATTPAGATSAIPAVWLIPDELVNSNIPSYAGDGTSGIYVAGGSFEAGTFPTSYFRTTSAQATRAADVASVNTLSPWFNPDEGTIFFEGSPISVAGPVKRAAALTNGTQQNRIVLDLAANSGIAEYLATAAGVSMASITSSAVSAGSVIKMAGVYSASDYRMAAKGVLGAGPAPGGAVPTITKLELGALVGAQFFNGHIRRVRYFPRRLTNAELQALTA